MVSGRDVAGLAGVSPATVSIVLNGRARELRIGDETVRRIEDAARELGYVAPHKARALATGRSQHIGLCRLHAEQDAASRRCGDLLLAASARAHRQGWLCSLAGTHDDGPLAAGLLACRSGRFDGLIVDCAGQPLADAAALLPGRGQLQSVLIDAADAVDSDQVRVDVGRGISQLLVRAADLAHRRLTVLTTRSEGNALLPTLEGRIEASALAMEVMPLLGAHDADGVCAMLQMLRARQQSTTLLLADDEALARDLLIASARLGIAVPDELSIVAIGRQVGGMHAPPLHAIDPGIEQLGLKAVELLARRLRGELPEQAQERRVHAVFVDGASLGAAP